MTEIDKDLQRRLKGFADGISPEPGRSAVVVRSARKKRRLVALSAGLAVVVAIAGLAGATTLLGNRDGIRPAPGPDDMADCEQPMYDVAVFVEDAATESQIQTLRGTLAADAEVESVTFMSKTAAFEEFKEHYADQPEFWENLPVDALPMSFRVSLGDDADIDAAARRFEALDHVEGVRTRGDFSKDEAPAATRPDCPSTRFARYVFDVTGGNASATGTLDVDTAAPKLCLTVASNNITASHLLLREPDRPNGQANVLFTFLDRDEAEQGPNLPMSRQCFRGDELRQLRNELQLLIDEPERFAIAFHRGPNDEPGLIAELVPVGDEEELADPLEDSIKAQGGTIRLQVIPGSIGRGRIAEVALVNETESQIFYGHEYELERQGLRGWRHVRSPDTCVFTQELLSVAPGENVRHPIGPYSDQCDVLPLRHGSYRVTKDVELESGERLALRVTFSIAPTATTMQILERQLADARTESRVRELVRSFMRRRVAGAGAEDFLDRQGRADFGPGGDLAPLYPDSPLQDFQIEFVDDLGDESYEVGMSLIFEEGSYGETLFVRERNGQLVISGGRPGVQGP